MKIGYVGLGKMGKNQVLRLREHNIDVVAYNRSDGAYAEIESAGAETSADLSDLVSKLESPRTVWLMVPHTAVDGVLSELVPLLSSGDTVIDGGNSNYKESMRRHDELKSKEINFIDVGVSGGPGGARDGACLMYGGDKDLCAQYEELYKAMAADGAYQYMGKAGAGHFTKMVHNGIEYGMMQAIAEGFEVLKKSDFDLSMSDAASIYDNQSVIESRLVNWALEGFEKYGEDLEEISSTVSHSGEGQWTVDAAKEMNVPVPIIEGSLDFRKQSEANPSYTGKMLSMLRNMFGGHKADK